MIKGVLFDLDETLLDRRNSLVAFLTAQHKENSVFQHLDKSIFISRFLALDNNGSVWKDVVYAELIKEFGLSCGVNDLLDGYVSKFSKFACLFPDALSALQSLKNKGIALGIISNGRHEFQMSVINALNLSDLMDVILISESEKVKKPDPEIFMRALNRLNIQAKDCVFIGDNPVADIIGADNIGMKTIWAENAFFQPPLEVNCPVLKKFWDLEDILLNF